MALLVLGPAFVGFKEAGLDAEAAGMRAWQLGMASLVIMGALKFVLSFAGDWVSRHVPRAGLLGSIAGIALVLMGFLPLIEVLRVPVVGFVVVGLVLVVLLAPAHRFARVPAVVLAVAIGAALYYLLGSLGALGSAYRAPTALSFALNIPWPSLGFVAGMADALPYLPLLIPFGILMVVGGINVSESARAAGDDYRTRDILLVEALSTLVAGVCGGVAQTTPYIGQPAYKAMGAGHGYTLATGVFIGVGGMLGVLAALVGMLPLAVLAPILIYVAINITVQAFVATPPRYAAAVVFSFFPAIARMVAIKLTDPALLPPERFAALWADTAHGRSDLFTIIVLGNGFILTSMVWAAFAVAVIDGRARRAAFALTIGALFCAFGLIHSLRPDGAMYLPWRLDAADWTLVLQWSGGYLTLAACAWLLVRPSRWGSLQD
jgi:AGZA family xanthine/uracil permease-like MFS transporter